MILRKIGDLGFYLPQNNEEFTTKSGDIILYQGNKFVIYYDANSWNFTKIAQIQNLSKDELKEILGDGDIKIKLKLIY